MSPLRIWPAGALWLTTPGCFICVEDYIKKWISWRRIILRNGPVGALRLPGPECLILLMDSIKKWTVGALWLTASGCFIFLQDYIEKWTSWSSVAHSFRMHYFLKGFYQEIDYVALWSPRPQNASFPGTSELQLTKLLSKCMKKL